MWANLGTGLCLGLSTLGAGWFVINPMPYHRSNDDCRGIFVTGASLMGGGVRTPRIRTKNLIRFVSRFLSIHLLSYL